MSSQLPKRPGRASYRSRGEGIYPGSLHDLVGPVIAASGVGPALWWCPDRIWRTDTMTCSPRSCFSLAGPIPCTKYRIHEKKNNKITRKGKTYLYLRTRMGAPEYNGRSRGFPDTYRSRAGPGHGLSFAGRTRTRASVRGTDPDTGIESFAGRTRGRSSMFTGQTRTLVFAIRGTPRRRSSFRVIPGFFCSRARPGRRLPRRTGPYAGFLHG